MPMMPAVVGEGIVTAAAVDILEIQVRHVGVRLHRLDGFRIHVEAERIRGPDAGRGRPFRRPLAVEEGSFADPAAHPDAVEREGDAVRFERGDGTVIVSSFPGRFGFFGGAGFRRLARFADVGDVMVSVSVVVPGGAGSSESAQAPRRSADAARMAAAQRRETALVFMRSTLLSPEKPSAHSFLPGHPECERLLRISPETPDAEVLDDGPAGREAPNYSSQP